MPCREEKYLQPKNKKNLMTTENYVIMNGTKLRLMQVGGFFFSEFPTLFVVDQIF